MCDDAVSKDTVKNLLCKLTCHPGVSCPDGYCKEINERVDALPSVTPSVIYCENCVHSYEDAIFGGLCCQKDRCKGKTEPDFFCGYAERRTDG